jgi:hypothetical protein
LILAGFNQAAIRKAFAGVFNKNADEIISDQKNGEMIVPATEDGGGGGGGGGTTAGQRQ